MQMRSSAPTLTLLTPPSTTRLPKDTLTLDAVSLDIKNSQIAAGCARRAMPRWRGATVLARRRAARPTILRRA